MGTTSRRLRITPRTPVPRVDTTINIGYSPRIVGKRVVRLPNTAPVEPARNCRCRGRGCENCWYTGLAITPDPLDLLENAGLGIGPFEPVQPNVLVWRRR